MLFACDVTNMSATMSTEGGKSPYELWFGTANPPDYLRLFGAVAYTRRSVCGHKMASKEGKRTFVGIILNASSGTLSVPLVNITNIV